MLRSSRPDAASAVAVSRRMSVPLIAEGERRQQPMHVLRAVIKTNEEQPGKLVQIVESAVDTLHPSASRYSAWRLSPTPTMCERPPRFPSWQRLVARERNSPRSGGVYCPGTARDLDIDLSSDLEGVLRDADAVARTRWKQYLEVPALLASVNSLCRSSTADACSTERRQLRGHRSGLIARLVALGCGKAGQTRARHRLSR